jgi:hypothetical protein
VVWRYTGCLTIFRLLASIDLLNNFPTTEPERPVQTPSPDRWQQLLDRPKIMRFIIFSLFSIQIVSSYGQTANNTSRKNESNIYYQALTQYLNYSKKTGSIYDTIYIEDDFKISSDSLLFESGKTKLIRLTFANVQQLLKTKDALTLYRIFPLEYENGKFSVSFIPFRVTKDLDKDNYNYSNGGGCQVFFKFKDNSFVFVKVDCRGI